ncbi:MAG TPA: hypothetical protein VF611_10340 [Pyrinomonadaceae bacterium]
MRRMTNYKLALLTAVCLLCGSLATAACSSGDPSAGAQSKPAAAQTVTAAAPDDSVGVAECDQYLAAYESCLNDKVPAAARDMMKSSFETTRASWRQAASTPEGRAGLATACKSARDAARQSMASYGCRF